MLSCCRSASPLVRYADEDLADLSPASSGNDGGCLYVLNDYDHRNKTVPTSPSSVVSSPPPSVWSSSVVQRPLDACSNRGPMSLSSFVVPSTHKSLPRCGRDSGVISAGSEVACRIPPQPYLGARHPSVYYDDSVVFMVNTHRAQASTDVTSGISSNYVYELSEDFRQKQIEALERRYGGRLVARRAAITIQRAYRRYSMARKFANLRQNRVPGRMVHFLTDSALLPMTLDQRQEVGRREKRLSSAPPASCYHVINGGAVGSRVPSGTTVSIAGGRGELRGSSFHQPQVSSSPSSVCDRCTTASRAMGRGHNQHDQPSVITDEKVSSPTKGNQFGVHRLKLHKYNCDGRPHRSAPIASMLQPTSPEKAARLIDRISDTSRASSVYLEHGRSVSVERSLQRNRAQNQDRTPQSTLGYRILSNQHEVFLRDGDDLRTRRDCSNLDFGEHSLELPQQQYYCPMATYDNLTSFRDDRRYKEEQRTIGGSSRWIAVDQAQDDDVPVAVSSSTTTPQKPPSTNVCSQPPLVTSAGSSDGTMRKIVPSVFPVWIPRMQVVRSGPASNIVIPLSSKVSSYPPSDSVTGAAFATSSSSMSVTSSAPPAPSGRQVRTAAGLVARYDGVNVSATASAAVPKATGSASARSPLELHEIARKRMYRIALNFFNKKPERGVQLLVQYGFVDGTPAAVAKFLLVRKGLSRQMIGEFLGNLQNSFCMTVLDYFVNEIDMRDLEIDTALRLFQSHFRLPGEAQKIERIMEVFSKRYCFCNPEKVRRFQRTDTVFILAFAIIMLNTDLHSPNLKPDRRMKLDDFVKNLQGIDGGRDLDMSMLTDIYRRVKEKEFKPAADHVSQVMKVDYGIVGKKPILALPHRRLVCYCRLYEVLDPHKKQSSSSHERGVYLFNDLLLITKVLSRKKSFSYKGSHCLVGMQVQPFKTQYYSNGIKISQTLESTVLYFNAKSENDRMRFMEDLRESIKESDDMETLRIEMELEKQSIRNSALKFAPHRVNEQQRDSGLSDIELENVSINRLSKASSLVDLSPQAVCQPVAPASDFIVGRTLSFTSLDSGMSSTASTASQDLASRPEDAARRQSTAPAATAVVTVTDSRGSRSKPTTSVS